MAQKQKSGFTCEICNRRGKSQKRFICELCLRQIFNGSKTDKVLYCKKCKKFSDMSKREYSILTQGQREDEGKKILVIIESCQHCNQEGDSTMSEIFAINQAPCI